MEVSNRNQVEKKSKLTLLNKLHTALTLEALPLLLTIQWFVGSKTLSSREFGWGELSLHLTIHCHMILREWETAKAEPANDFLYNILPEKVCIILSWLELWYCNPFFIGGIMVDVNFLHTNWQTKLIKYQTTYTMRAEKCILSEWIIYLREQFEVSFEQNIEKRNKVCIITFPMTMVRKTRENMHSESRVLYYYQ